MNSFKSNFSHHLPSIPCNSNVFLSFGEIDCRENEGILAFVEKYDQDLDRVISQTVSGYVNFVLQQFLAKQCQLFFLGVPAPWLHQDNPNHLNAKERALVSVVQNFNAKLKQLVVEKEKIFVDLFVLSAGKFGASNKLYHIDNRHLGPAALNKLQEIISE